MVKRTLSDQPWLKLIALFFFFFAVLVWYRETESKWGGREDIFSEKSSCVLSHAKFWAFHKLKADSICILVWKVKEYEYFLLLKVAKSQMEFWISSYLPDKLANNFVHVHLIFMKMEWHWKYHLRFTHLYNQKVTSKYC